MKKAVRETSKQAYLELSLDGTKETLQHRVLKLLQVRPSTIRELAGMLNKDTSSISGRVNELFKQKLIEINCKRTCNVSQKRVIEWKMKGVK